VPPKSETRKIGDSFSKHWEYPIALKRAALARVAAGESIAEVARDLKLRGRLLYAWRDKVRTGGPAALRERDDRARGEWR
jgi:transposase-like protein